MGRTWKGLGLWSVLGATALAAPPVPTTSSPVDGGWAAKRASLSARLLPQLPADVPAFEFETHAPQGTVTWSGSAARSTSTTTITTTSGALPDAGLHFWRVRAVDDAGVASAWSNFESLRVDDEPAPNPASLTVAVDGGFVDLSCPPVTDTQSGVGRYHFFVSDLDPPDGSVLTGSGPVGPSLLLVAPAGQFALGPGRWNFGVHVHDGVDNIPPGAVNAGPVDIPAALTVPVPPAPFPVRLDGGLYARFPYLSTDTPRFTSTSDGGVGFVLVSRPLDAGTSTLIGFGAARTVTTTNMAQGPQEVRLARLEPTEVSDWSAPVFVWVDITEPLTPSTTAVLDGGVVTVTWSRAADRNATTSGSGVEEYRVTRCCAADGSVPLAAVTNTPDASLVVEDTPGPGPWTFAVVAVDRAGNLGQPGTATVRLAPPAPAPRTSTPITTGPVNLDWDDVTDGGFVAVYDVLRVDGDGGAVDAGAAFAATAAVLPTPEGAWTFSVRAVTGGVPSAWSAGVPVLVDSTPPQVSDVVARRLDARTLRLEWTASDALSGLGPALVERDTGGVTSTFDAGTAPFVDAPPDGTHRYRVTAVDLAGNTATSAWTAPLETPGSSVAITPVPDGTAQCGRELAIQLQATGDPVTRWSLVDPAPPGASIDQATGLLRYRPTSADVGAQSVAVRAESATGLDEEAVVIVVTCTADRYGVHCGCAAGGEGLLLVALLLRPRRRARR